ncbi:unnamed protein product [Vitrella brassicaformis CCMP3155]|uniref:Uncharacterized protein n=2 Tax=Vitrella brassicaformis TaxID=1169539 RepID=A0A0G4FZD5_VITBC|nr:unnamed protein product [Vitrella brassicaformis CCMP3155]|mmetsp:Transcript_21048/g.60094  ORF Transcript_21048/g.60094 Transcript_21048/m.60094 type:complete len:209 (+) Transcript_21048:920-1546(+)|eukprot:CEM20888.1 unnamed protein product [Vitrella brassicaformis CCMP3155]
MALRRVREGVYQMDGDFSALLRVVPVGDLPAPHNWTVRNYYYYALHAPDHPFAWRYKKGDPVIRCRGSADQRVLHYLYNSFSSFLCDAFLNAWHRVYRNRVLLARIGYEGGYRSLLTGAISEDEAIVVDRLDDGDDLSDVTPSRLVIASGFRPDETTAAWLVVRRGDVELWTTELSLAARRFDARFPVSAPHWRRALRRFRLENAVIG